MRVESSGGEEQQIGCAVVPEAIELQRAEPSEWNGVASSPVESSRVAWALELISRCDEVSESESECESVASSCCCVEAETQLARAAH